MENENIEVEDTQEIEGEIEEVKETEEEVHDEKMFSQTELDSIVQTRLDRALKKAAKETKQAEELAKLGEKERAKRELEIKEDEFEEEKQRFYKERLELQTTKELDKIDIPIAFTEFVIGEDAESTQARIVKFNNLWEQELSARRIESLKGTTPSDSNKQQANNKAQDFMTMASEASIRK